MQARFHQPALPAGTSGTQEQPFQGWGGLEGPPGRGRGGTCPGLMGTPLPHPSQEDTISINHNWVNGCNLANMWHFLQQELCAVQQEVSEWRDTMPDWHHHCQVGQPGQDGGVGSTGRGSAGLQWGLGRGLHRTTVGTGEGLCRAMAAVWGGCGAAPRAAYILRGG